MSGTQAGQVELMNCNGYKLMQYYAEQIAELKCAGPFSGSLPLKLIRRRLFME